MVVPGQVWRDLDKRMNGRLIQVDRVADGKAFVSGGITRSVISIKRMRRTSTGFELVKDVVK